MILESVWVTARTDIFRFSFSNSVSLLFCSAKAVLLESCASSFFLKKKAVWW